MQENDIRLRRIRLISDVMEDYQDNVNRAIRLIEQDTGFDQYRERPSRSGQAHANGDREPRRYYAFPPTPSLFNNENTSFFNRAVGGLNSDQIQQYTTQVAYDSTTMNETHCPITWEPFFQGQELLRVNTCNHNFSRDAIIEWFSRNRHCPVCRSNPVSQVSNIESPQNSPTYNVLGYSAVVSLEPLDSSANYLDASGGSVPLQNTTDQPANIVNTLLRGLVGNLRRSLDPQDVYAEDSTRNTTENPFGEPIGIMNEALNSNAEYYEREFTFNLNDLLNLSADALANEASRVLSSSTSTRRERDNQSPQ
jgi:hypothetical protein